VVDCYDEDCCIGDSCGEVDFDGDNVSICVDCREGDGTIWDTPGEVRDVGFDLVLGELALSWSEPLAPGGSALNYETIRAENPDDFLNNVTCLVAVDPAALHYIDTEDPEPGNTFCYLVRAENNCPIGLGTAGSGSGGDRSCATCP